MFSLAYWMAADLVNNRQLDFAPVQADFGTTLQEFHTGRGATATPGMVAGLSAISDELGRMPFASVLEPAIELARNGVEVNPLQAFILDAVSPIMLFSSGSRAVYGSRQRDGSTVTSGEILSMPALAVTLEGLAREGSKLFYRGEVGRMIVDQSADGGLISAADLAAYEVVRRRPLSFDFAGHRVLTNPPPSSGGALIVFSLALIEALELDHLQIRGGDWLIALADVMETANRARREIGLLDDCNDENVATLLSGDVVSGHGRALTRRAEKIGGTTHVSIIDAAGNVAALSVSNGEGCGHMLGATGVMLNNMLGEEDINPSGFFNWRPNTRITSMMAPTIVDMADGTRLGLGSGGSNRIRTAILQVLTNRLRFADLLEDAVSIPRIHFERGTLHLEGGQPDAIVEQLRRSHADVKIWPGLNFFFGGVHAASSSADRMDFAGAGDPRRGGVAISV